MAPGALTRLYISSQGASGLYTLQPASTRVVLYEGGVVGIVDTLDGAVA
jgi:hypothetical protein